MRHSLAPVARSSRHRGRRQPGPREIDEDKLLKNALDSRSHMV